MKIIKRSFAKGYVCDVIEKEKENGSYSVLVVEHDIGYCDFASALLRKITTENVEDLVKRTELENAYYEIVDDLISVDDCEIKIYEILDEISPADEMVDKVLD
jgi:hypothetical protein